jgi:hypothetical protein
MDDNETTERNVDDADIQAIIDQGEAGVRDLITAYEPVEQQYFSAVRVSAPSVTYSIDTNPR